MGSIPHKFPRTSHLFGSRSTRDDRVLSERETVRVLSQPLLIEEKIDGANVGISFDRDATDNLVAVIQNRGHYLGPGDHAQYGPLWPFLYERLDSLREMLGDNKILFGEWCYAKHSCFYDQLPSYFLAFDLYDKESQRFFSRKHLAVVCEKTDCAMVPLVAQSSVVRTTKELNKRIGQSAFGPEQAEGVYLREQSEDLLVRRFKWVRQDFTAGITEHWNSKPLVPNRLAATSGQT